MKWVLLVVFVVVLIFLVPRVPRMIEFLKKVQAYRKRDVSDKEKSENKTSSEENGSEENPSYYKRVLITWALAIILIFVFYVLPYWSDTNVTNANVAKAVGMMLVVWLGDALTVVKVNQFCGLTLFGRRVKTFGPGLYIFPRFLFQRYIFKSDIYEIYWPAKQDEIFHGDDKELVPLGKARAWRILTGAPEEPEEPEEQKEVASDKADALNKVKTLRKKEEEISYRNILDVQQYVSLSGFTAWQIEREKLFDFILASGGDTKQVEDQIFSITHSALTSQVGEYTISGVNKQLTKIAEENKAEVQKVLEKKYGVTIITHTINPPNISHELAQAQRDANIARAAAVKTKTAADAEKYRLIKVGEGNGLAEEAYLASEGEGMKKAADILNISPEVYYAGRVAMKTIGEGDATVLGTESIGGIVGGVTASLLKNTPSKTKKENTDTPEGGEA